MVSSCIIIPVQQFFKAVMISFFAAKSKRDIFLGCGFF